MHPCRGVLRSAVVERRACRRAIGRSDRHPRFCINSRWFFLWVSTSIAMPSSPPVPSAIMATGFPSASPIPSPNELASLAIALSRNLLNAITMPQHVELFRRSNAESAPEAISDGDSHPSGIA